MSDAILALIAVAVGGMFTFLGVRLTARQASHATDSTATVENRQVDIEEWKTLLDTQGKVYAGHVSTLRDDLTAAIARVDLLETKIGSVTDALSREEGRSRMALRYLREVLAWVQVQFPDAVPPPMPPELRPELT